jgi:hypothetical protein
LAVAFATVEARHVTGVTPTDKDPDSYIREVEEELADGQSTAAGKSLGIGSLNKG